MQLQEFLNKLNSGNTVHTGSEVHQFMHKAAQEALKLTAQLNNSYHTPDEIRQIFSTIIGKPVDNTFGLFPPFYTDCGKNIRIGKHVFINMGCKFQDQGGITIGDETLIMISTLQNAVISFQSPFISENKCGLALIQLFYPALPLGMEQLLQPVPLLPKMYPQIPLWEVFPQK